MPARVQRLPNISGLSQADCRYRLRSLGFLVDLIQAFVRRNRKQLLNICKFYLYLNMKYRSDPDWTGIGMKIPRRDGRVVIQYLWGEDKDKFSPDI